MVDCEINTLPLHTPKGRKGSPFFFKVNNLGETRGSLRAPLFLFEQFLDVLWILGGLYSNGIIPSTDDMNEYGITGVYKISSQNYPSNLPQSLLSGTPSIFVEVIKQKEIIIQKIYTLLGDSAWRTWYSSVGWSAWRIVPNS